MQENELLEQELEYVESSVKMEDMLNENNPFFNMFPPLIKELIKEEIPVITDMGKGYFIVPDFYKTKEIKLVVKPDMSLIAFDMDGAKEVKTVEDIVRLNFNWLLASTTKNGIPPMTKTWGRHLLKRKWLKRNYYYVPDVEAFENDNPEKLNLNDKIKNNLENNKNKIDKELEEELGVENSLKTEEINSKTKEEQELEELERLTNPNQNQSNFQEINKHEFQEINKHEVQEEDFKL